MSLKEVIQEKIQLIEEKTGNRVRKREKRTIEADAQIDWNTWITPNTELPWILYKPRIDLVHILHELIHLENFFVDQFSLIATNDATLHSELDIFKNIPEDYVAHKILYHKYDLDPIDKKWFTSKDSLMNQNNKIAANLVNFYAFSEFCKEFKDDFNSFRQKCRQRKVIAYSMAERAIEALDKMDYTDKESYNKCAEKIIRIFVLNYYNSRKIYLSFISKEENKWCWNP